MLKDRPRQEAYKEAIFTNKELFKDKIILDVGAGTGILSIWAAQFGAKKVLGVEASNLANIAKEIVKENELEQIVEIYHSQIEDFKLPDGIESVDIIISEWMG
jgi:predicted RNA methylase